MEQPAYLEMVDFIAGGATSRQVADFHPSPATQRRAAELLAKAKDDALSPTEKAELDHYVELEHLLRLAKARARVILAAAG